MAPDKWQLYQHMYYSRLFEEAVRQLWHDGKIYGEMHLGIGEEAIMAGIVSQLEEGDAMSLDHRGTSPLLIRGCDPVKLMREFLGFSDGLCSGMGGHMHLFSKEFMTVSSGIVGASGPAAVGFALSLLQNKSNAVVVCFFGEGAINQGMLMESFNLAVIWKLPILFICKDDDMAITTKSAKVTGGNLSSRAASFGMPANEIKEIDVEVTWKQAKEALDYLRKGKGPYFIHAHCVHFEGHFLGDPILRQFRHPLKEFSNRALPLVRSLTRKKGVTFKERIKGIEDVSSVFSSTFKEKFSHKRDPLIIMRKKLLDDQKKLMKIEQNIKNDIRKIVEKSLNNIK